MATSANTPTGPMRSARRVPRSGKPYAKGRPTTIAGKDLTPTIEQEQSFLKAIASGVTSLVSRTFNSALNTLFSEDLASPARRQKQRSLTNQIEEGVLGETQEPIQKKQSLLRPELAPHFVGQTPWVVRKGRGNLPKDQEELADDDSATMEAPFKKPRSMSDLRNPLQKKKSFQITAETYARRDAETLKWLGSHGLSLRSLLSDETPPLEHHADIERFQNLRLDLDFLDRQGLQSGPMKSKPNGVSKAESSFLPTAPSKISHAIPPPDLTDPRLHLDPVEWPRSTGPQILAAWKEVCRRWEIICREEKSRNQFDQSHYRHRRSASAMPILIKAPAPTTIAEEDHGEITSLQERRKRSRQISNESPPRKRKAGNSVARTRRAASEVPTSSKTMEPPKPKTRRRINTLPPPSPQQVDESAKISKQPSSAEQYMSSNLAPIADTKSAPSTSQKVVAFFDVSMIPEARKKRPGFFSAREEDLDEIFGPMQDIEMENEHPRKKTKMIVDESTISKSPDKIKAREVDMSWENGSTALDSPSKFGFKPRVPALRDSATSSSTSTLLFGIPKDNTELPKVNGQSTPALFGGEKTTAPSIQFATFSPENNQVSAVLKKDNAPTLFVAPAQLEEKTQSTSEHAIIFSSGTTHAPEPQKKSEVPVKLPAFTFGATKPSEDKPETPSFFDTKMPNSPAEKKDDSVPKFSFGSTASSSIAEQTTNPPVPSFGNTVETKINADAVSSFNFGTPAKTDHQPKTNGFSFTAPATSQPEKEETPKPFSFSVGAQPLSHDAATSSFSLGTNLSANGSTDEIAKDTPIAAFSFGYLTKQPDMPSATASPFRFPKKDTTAAPSFFSAPKQEEKPASSLLSSAATAVIEKATNPFGFTGPPAGAASFAFGMSDQAKKVDPARTQLAFGATHTQVPGNAGETDMDMDGQNLGGHSPATNNEPSKPSGFAFGTATTTETKPVVTTNGFSWGISTTEKKDEAPKPNTTFSSGNSLIAPQNPFGAPGASTQFGQGNETKKSFNFGPTNNETPKPSFSFGNNDAVKTANTNTFAFGNIPTPTESKSDFSFGSNNFGSNNSTTFGQSTNTLSNTVVPVFGATNSNPVAQNNGFSFNFGGGSTPPVFGAPQQQQAAPSQLNFSTTPSFNFGTSTSGVSNQPTTPTTPGQSNSQFVLGAAPAPTPGFSFNIGAPGNAAASPGGGRKIAPMKSRRPGRR
ncbi:Nucleoporin nup124 [Neolecta irregularis DAH-3]|uniref:Nucleoporin nup124 n=1 Tax=Neolecta irregularis (strain DAH-3) TaxID=1198029 RepID=A0A1U7LV93_NEOID|nr:Nucleoporin nup124 [Neolecta irregularis DAH-3]|eukprot:OLL26538.1 Nucleoporin nup124 [Neolecta irregularis DAH-3]